MPNDYGIIAAGQALIGFLWIFSGFGTYEAAVQKPELSDKDCDFFFTVNVLLGVCLFVISCLSSPLLAYFFSEPILNRVIPALSVTFLINPAGQLHNALLARKQSYRTMVFLDLSGQGLAAVLSVLLAMIGAGVWSLVALNILIAGVPSIAVWFVSPWRPTRFLPGHFREMRGAIAFSASIMVGNWLNYFSGQVDRVIIGRIFGMNELGLYSRAHQLATYSSNIVFIGPHRYVTARLARLQNDLELYRKELLRILTIGCLVAVFINGWCMVNSHGLVHLLFGIKWLRMSPYFFWISLGNCAFVLAYSFQWIHMSLGSGRAYIGTNVLRLILTASSVAVGLHWGITGVCIGYSAYLWLFAIITSWSTAHQTNGRTHVFLLTLVVPSLLVLPGGLISIYFFPVADVAFAPLAARSLLYVSVFLGLALIFQRPLLKEIVSYLPTAGRQ